MHVSITIDDGAPDAVEVTSGDQGSAAADSAPAEVLARAAAVGAKSAGAAPTGPGAAGATGDVPAAPGAGDRPGVHASDPGDAFSAGPAVPFGGE